MIYRLFKVYHTLKEITTIYERLRSFYFPKPEPLTLSPFEKKAVQKVVNRDRQKAFLFANEKD